MATATTLSPALPPLGDPFFYGWRYILRRNDDGSESRQRVPLSEWDVLHPQEDDFIVHNDIHDDTTAYLKNVFRWRLADHPDALVLHDHRVDWQVEGIEPHGPDVVVFFDAGPWERVRGTYPMRDQGARPIVVIEVTSPSTRAGDLGDKVSEYYLAGIPRYLIVDITVRAGRPNLRLLDYRPTPEGPVLYMANDPTRAWLPDLNLWIAIQGDRVVCLEPSGQPVGDYLEVARLAQAAEAKLAENAALLSLERSRAEQEKARAEQEKARAEQEKARAVTAEEKLAELEAELRRLRGN